MLVSLSCKFMAILQSGREIPNMIPTNEDELTLTLHGPLHAQCSGLMNFTLLASSNPLLLFALGHHGPQNECL